MHEHVFIRTESLQQGWPGFGGWDTEAEVAAARERLSRLSQAGAARFAQAMASPMRFAAPVQASS